MLELISTSDAPISQLIAKMPVSHVTHLQVDCPWELKGTVMRRMTEKLHDGRVSLVDGIKVFLEKGEWALVLPDAEEAVFHVYAEASGDVRAAELADKYRVILEEVVAEGRE